LNFSNQYIVGFALAVCLVCSLAVSALAVALKPQQDANRLLDQQENILRVSGLWTERGHPPPEQAAALFAQIITWRVDRTTGAMTKSETFVPAKEMIDAAKDPAASAATASASAKGAQIGRTPNVLLVFQVTAPGQESWVLPIWGNGLWSTMYGFLSVAPDFTAIRGITFYQHGETPGLGGEIDNPSWRAQWPGKKLIGPDGQPVIEVVKNGNVRDASRQVDGISGSTITSRGVSHTVRTWLGDEGYGPWIGNVLKAAKP
jgi:Na+-transporting NADH:ubiquinone oxidoreductase subunit C